MWDLKLDTRRLVEGFSTSVLWDRPNILWEKADDWWNDVYITDSDTAAFLSATAIIDPNKQNYVNNLVIALKTTGLWYKMKAIYPFISEQRNLLNKTDDFTDSSWIKVGATVIPNDTTAPDGTLTADKIVFSGSTREIYQGISSAGTYAVSVYIKGTAGETISFSDGVGIAGQIFTLDGTWQRIQFTTTASSSQFDVNTYGGATARTIWLWGAQLEINSVATDYQPTINAQEQFAAAYKYNLKDARDLDAAFRLKIFGGWTFTSTGATPNGTNAYMDTGLVPSTSLSTSSAHLSFYSRTNQANGGYELARGNYSLIVQFSGNTFYVNLENSGAYSASTTNTDGRGFYIGSRLNNTTVQGFKNNTKVINTSLGSSLTSSSLYIGANGIPGNYSTKQCAFASIGDGLTDTEASNLYTIVQQFQTNLNRQV